MERDVLSVFATAAAIGTGSWLSLTPHCLLLQVQSLVFQKLRLIDLLLNLNCMEADGQFLLLLDKGLLRLSLEEEFMDLSLG